jgi:hypothetical protein
MIEPSPHLLRVVHRVVRQARSEGLDHVGQTHRSVAELLRVRPDLTASDAFALVDIAGPTTDLPQ